jgi:hypothetical protein
MGLWLLLTAVACSSEPNMPPTAAVTEIETASRPAKDPNCYMPVIYSEPTVEYRKIAIVDAWASLEYSQQQVLDEIKRKACETGADAVLMLGGSDQVTRKLLYGGAPDPARNQDPGTQSADIINDKEHEADVGSVGHRGTYVDAVAIIYGKPSGN